MAKMAQRQNQVSIEGIPGLWATKSGGAVSADVTPVWDGGTDHPEQLSSPPTAENVTTSRPMDDGRDLTELKRLRRLVGRYRATITVQSTNGDGFPVGDPTVYPDALLVTMSEPEYDAAGGDPQVLELEWAISQYV